MRVIMPGLLAIGLMAGLAGCAPPYYPPYAAYYAAPPNAPPPHPHRRPPQQPASEWINPEPAP